MFTYFIVLRRSLTPELPGSGFRSPEKSPKQVVEVIRKLASEWDEEEVEEEEEEEVAVKMNGPPAEAATEAIRQNGGAVAEAEEEEQQQQVQEEVNQAAEDMCREEVATIVEAVMQEKGVAVMQEKGEMAARGWEEAAACGEEGVAGLLDSNDKVAEQEEEEDDEESRVEDGMMTSLPTAEHHVRKVRI